MQLSNAKAALASLQIELDQARHTGAEAVAATSILQRKCEEILTKSKAASEQLELTMTELAQAHAQVMELTEKNSVISEAKKVVERSLLRERAKLSSCGVAVSTGTAGRPRRASASASPSPHACSQCSDLEASNTRLRGLLKDCRQQKHNVHKRLSRLRAKFGNAPPSAQSPVGSEELIQMREARNKLTVEHKLWADAMSHANPGSHVGDWKQQTEATAKLFKVRPIGYKPMAGGSIYRTREEVDAVKTLKEKDLLKGKQVQIQFDLTPIAKRDICGTSVTFSVLQDDGSIVDFEFVLTLTWVAGKDGRVIAERIREVLTQHGIDAEDVVWAITDGGGDNHGGNTATGHGENGTIVNSVAHAVWLWCQVHMAQLVYKDAMKEIPLGFLAGLKEVVRFVRCGSNWKKLLPVMSRLAGEKGALFQESILIALIADELDWGERVKKNPKLLAQRKRKGYKIHELFSHAILKGASDIRFASAIPGIHQIIAVFPLLKEAIRIVSGGGDLAKISSVRAHNARGVLDNDEWHFYARVVATTAKEVVTPMFTFLMKTNGYNAPEMVQGKWKEWASCADALLNADGSLRIESCDEASEWAAKLSEGVREQAMKHAAAHIKGLSESTTRRFGAVWSRVDFLPCALLAQDGHAEYSSKILAELSTLDVTTHPQHKRFINFATKHKADLVTVSQGTSPVSALRVLHRALVENFRIRTDMINQERSFAVLTNYEAKAHNAGMHCYSLVARTRKNKTELSAAEYEELLPMARQMLLPDSSFKALFKDPNWVYAWLLKNPDAPTTIPDLEADKVNYDVFKKHSAELAKEMKTERETKRRRVSGSKMKNSDSEWTRDREDEKLMAMDQPITADTDGADLDALMIMSSAASEEGQAGQVVQVEAQEGVPKRRSRRIHESDGSSDEQGGSEGESEGESEGDEGEEAVDDMFMCECCGEEREAEVMVKYRGQFLCPACKQEAQVEAAASKKAARSSESEKEGESDMESGVTSWYWDDDDVEGHVEDIVDMITKKVLFRNAITHRMVWKATKQSYSRIQPGDHVVVNLEGEGRTVVEVRKLFEDEDEELRFEGLCCYNSRQLSASIPFFNKQSTEHAVFGFKPRTELVLCSNPFFMFIEDILEKKYVSDHVNEPKQSAPTGRCTLFYRYIVDVISKEVEPVRGGTCV